MYYCSLVICNAHQRDHKDKIQTWSILRLPHQNNHDASVNRNNNLKPDDKENRRKSSDTLAIVVHCPSDVTGTSLYDWWPSTKATAKKT